MKNIICVMCLLFIAFFPCLAQSISAPLGNIIAITPDKAVEMAINNNLDIQQALLLNKAKRRAAIMPWNVFIPTVDISGTMGRLNQEPQPTAIGPFSIPAGPQWRLLGSIQFGININIGMFAGTKQIIEEYEAGKISIEKARLQLERDVRKAYYLMLLAQEQITLLEDSYANAERQVNMAHANYRAGLIPEVDLMEAQVARENLKPQIDEAENSYCMAMSSFAMFLGLPYDTEFELAPLPGNAEFIVMDTHDLISRSASNKPDTEELKRNLIALKFQKTALFYTLFTPTLYLGYNMDPAFLGDPMKDSWFNGDLWKQQSGLFMITLAWRLNALLPFTKEFQNYQAMSDMIRAMEIGLGRAVQGTEMEVYNIIMQLEKTRTIAEAQQARVDLAEQPLRLSEAAYQHGLKSFMDVQNNELALRQARMGSLQQHFYYLMGLIDLEYAIGVPFGSLGGMN